MNARAAAIPRTLWARARRTANRSVLQPIELIRSDGSAAPLEQKPLLVIGAPRSGSTLLYQLLTQRFDVTYLGNRHCAFFGAPSLVERLGGRNARPPADYVSRHGRTSGAWGPSECGPFWYRFFRKSPQYVALSDAKPSDLTNLRSALRALGNAGERPLVFKNLLCALRLEPIAEAIPEARFVVIRRDAFDNARSILVSRLRANGEAQSWWSAEPPGWEQLRELDPAEQALGQIDAIHSVIDDARERFGDSRFCDVEYERLIEDPPATLASIGTFARGQGIMLDERFEVPASFPRSEAGELPPELEQSLARSAEARA